MLSFEIEYVKIYDIFIFLGKTLTHLDESNDKYIFGALNVTFDQHHDIVRVSSNLDVKGLI